MPFCTKWHSCDSLFFVQFTAQLIAYRLPAFFVLLHKCHVLRGYINITVVAFFCGCVLIAEVPKNQKALVDMNGILPSALVHRPPKVITPTSRHAPRARLRQDKPPRAHIECAPTDFVFGQQGHPQKDAATLFYGKIAWLRFLFWLCVGFPVLNPACYRTLRISCTRSAITMGLDRKPFMPHSRALRRSSSKAFAVMARMGIPARAGFSSSRMRRVAV